MAGAGLKRCLKKEKKRTRELSEARLAIIILILSQSVIPKIDAKVILSGAKTGNSAFIDAGFVNLPLPLRRIPLPLLRIELPPRRMSASTVDRKASIIETPLKP
jgi:hypothetical protein